jgi:hypothetical protein
LGDGGNRWAYVKGRVTTGRDESGLAEEKEQPPRGSGGEEIVVYDIEVPAERSALGRFWDWIWGRSDVDIVESKLGVVQDSVRSSRRRVRTQPQDPEREGVCEPDDPTSTEFESQDELPSSINQGVNAVGREVTVEAAGGGAGAVLVNGFRFLRRLIRPLSKADNLITPVKDVSTETDKLARVWRGVKPISADAIAEAAAVDHDVFFSTEQFTVHIGADKFLRLQKALRGEIPLTELSDYERAFGARFYDEAVIRSAKVAERGDKLDFPGFNRHRAAFLRGETLEPPGEFNSWRARKNGR